jgi:hypothetical protein
VKTPTPKRKKAPNRTRKAVNLTLSDEAREKGEELAAKRGIRFAQLVEQLVRAELREAGILKPEGEKK